MAATPNNDPPLIQPISMTPPPPQPTAPTPPKADEAAIKPAKPDTVDKPESAGKAAGAEKDPMRELLDRMERLHSMVAAVDPALAKTLQSFSQRGADSEQRAQPGFRTDVAYALQDLEKHHFGRLEIPTVLRSEMTQLAGTAVGLTNERMIALMQMTPSLQERSLVSDIRDAGREIGRRLDQSHPEATSHIDALENRVRLMIRPDGPAVSGQTASPQGNGGSDRSSRGPRDDLESEPARAPNGTPSGASNLIPNGTPNVMQSGTSTGTRLNGNPSGDPNQGPVTLQHSVLDTLLRAMRPDGRQAQAPWEPPAAPVADRMAASERRSQTESEDRSFKLAERRGQAALDALQGFANGEGATVMNRIREAAKTEPGGMPQVLSEMREGGRFADLRKQFGNALTDDAGFAAAYEKAAGALAAYGKTRTDIEPIIARRPDAAGFTQRLGELDAEIGKAAAATPSKTEGRSMIEDLAKQVSELLQRAVEAVKAAGTRTPSPSAATSASPGP